MSASNGIDEDLTNARAEEAVERRKESTAKDAAAWLDEPDEPERPVVEELIEEGECVAVVGSAKAGKSLLALQLALCIAAGIPFLGKPTVRHKVYVANLEVATRQYKKRLRRMVEALDIAPDRLRGWLFFDNLKNKGVDWDYVKDNAAAWGAGFVLVDPFYQIFDGAEVDEEAVQAAIGRMMEFQRDGFTLAVVFHAPKGFNGDRNLIDLISGSSRLARYPEGILGLLNHAEGGKYRVFSAVLRNFPPPEDLTLTSEGGALEALPEKEAVVETAKTRAAKANAAGGAIVKKEQNAKDTDKMRRDLLAVINARQAAKAAGLLPKAAIATELVNNGYPERRVRAFIEGEIAAGRLMETPELEIGPEGYGITKNRNKGGRVLLSTPDAVEEYVNGFPKPKSMSNTHPI